MKKGLILEGGAMRGMFTAGVIDVFLENNIAFDGAVGVSAGAVFGCNLKSHQLARAIRYNMKYCNDRRYISFRNWLKTGELFGVDFCYHELPRELDIFDTETYAKDPMDFYVVATDAITGKPHYQLCNNGDDYDVLWMRASASMPIFAHPVEIDGGFYSDGGTADSVPIKFMESIGYDDNTIVLTRPKGYRKKPYGFSYITKKVLKDYPNLVKALEERYIMYNETMDYIDKGEAEGKFKVIRPVESVGIGQIERNPKELQRVYQLGRTEGKKLLNT